MDKWCVRSKLSVAKRASESTKSDNDPLALALLSLQGILSKI